MQGAMPRAEGLHAHREAQDFAGFLSYLLYILICTPDISGDMKRRHSQILVTLADLLILALHRTQSTTKQNMQCNVPGRKLNRLALCGERVQGH